MTRLIDAEALKNDLITFFPDECLESITTKTLFKQILTDIDNAPTVKIPIARYDAYCEGQKVGYEKGITDRPQGECKTCKYYHPYYKQFSNEPRGDGYCVIARMTSEGMTTINCNDEFGCSDYQKGGAE